MPSFSESNQNLREALRQFLWDQWVSIGVAGGASFAPVRFVVDPEALVLATTRFGREDARLFGESLDWLRTNGGLIGLQRLKTLQSTTQIGDRRVLAAIGSHLGKDSWNTLTGPQSVPLPRLTEWFPGAEFAARGISKRPNPEIPEAFLFKMRAFFGTNARAEVFTWLLGRPSGHAAAIARETGWLAKTVQVVLNEMADSGLIFVSAGDREKRFYLRHECWRFLMPKSGPPVWWPQAPFYLGCANLLRVLDELEASSAASAGLQSIKIRAGLATVAAAFRLAGFDHLFSAGARLTGESLVEVFLADVTQVVGILTSRKLLPQGF